MKTELKNALGENTGDKFKMKKNVLSGPIRRSNFVTVYILTAHQK